MARHDSNANVNIARQLGSAHDDTLIDVVGLGALLCLTPETARQAAYRKAEHIPPRFPSRQLRWRLGDVRAWIRAQAQHDTPRPKRSRKAEQVRLQRLGDAIRQGE